MFTPKLNEPYPKETGIGCIYNQIDGIAPLDPVKDMKYACDIVGGRNKGCSFRDGESCKYLEDSPPEFRLGVYEVINEGFNSERDLVKIENDEFNDKEPEIIIKVLKEKYPDKIFLIRSER